MRGPSGRPSRAGPASPPRASPASPPRRAPPNAWAVSADQSQRAPGDLTALGRRSEYRYESPQASVLESFANPSPGSLWAVALLCLEFTTLCPVTGQPDYGRLRIDYVPAATCVESKSLKLYLMRYRNEGSFHEACVNRVADDLVSAVSPRMVRVHGDFNPRGGIAIHPLAVRVAPGLSEGEEARCRRTLDDVMAYDRSAL